MTGSDVVELLVGGVRVAVSREAGLELLERDSELLTRGLVEIAVVELPGLPPRALHLLLGGGHLALIENVDDAVPPDLVLLDESRSDAARTAEGARSVELFFPDFDRYAT